MVVLLENKGVGSRGPVGLRPSMFVHRPAHSADVCFAKANLDSLSYAASTSSPRCLSALPPPPLLCPLVAGAAGFPLPACQQYWVSNEPRGLPS